MRRNELLLWAGVLLLGCGEADAPGDPATAARARELLGVPAAAPVMAKPAGARVPTVAPGGQAVVPAAGALPAPAELPDPGPADPVPPALAADLPPVDVGEGPKPVKTVDPVPADFRATAEPWHAGPDKQGGLYAPVTAAGDVDVSDRGSWLGKAPELPDDEELAQEGEPGHDDLRPMGTAEQLSMDFPWGKGEDGNWQGTGVSDPAPLRTVSNADIVAAASDAGSDPDVRNKRLTALVSVGRRKLPGSLSILGSALGDGELMVRQLALSGLIEHGGPGALPLMWRAMRDGHPHVRGMAVWAIALYGTAEASKAIDAGLADADPGVQGMAVLATTALRDMSKIWSVLEVAAASDDQRLYQEAAYVLTNLESRRALELLAKTLRGSTDRLKRQTYAHYLKVARRNHPHLLAATR